MGLIGKGGSVNTQRRSTKAMHAPPAVSRGQSGAAAGGTEGVNAQIAFSQLDSR